MRASAPRRVLLALAADVLVLLVFLYVALGAGSSGEQPVLGEELPVAMDAQLSAPQVPAAAPGPGTVKAGIEDMLTTSEVDAGVALMDSGGDLVLGSGEDQPFVLASVAKVYILVAYLDQVSSEGRRLSDSDLSLLQPMIRYSDNDSASYLWDEIGGEAGIAAFLESKGLAAVRPTEEDAWGTLYASASQVAELLWRLAYAQLLDPESTQVALSLLSDIDSEQAWGVSAGAGQRGDEVLLKNGWYPEVEGWRVNSAGAVMSTEGGYVLVILTHHSESLGEGIALVEDIAARINAFMSN